MENILKNEWRILDPFASRPWKKLTFRQIKLLAKNKSDNYVHSTLKKFVRNQILNEEKIGNIIVYSINPNTNSLNLLGYIAEFKTSQCSIPKIPDRILEKIPVFSTLLITGSHAKSKQTKMSDLDIILLINNSTNPSRVLSKIKTDCELSIPEIHAYIFTEEQFYKMLINEEENYGKEAARNNLILFGGSSYYKIILKAVKNGFNG